jgi:hypothetical protein
MTKHPSGPRAALSFGVAGALAATTRGGGGMRTTYGFWVKHPE